MLIRHEPESKNLSHILLHYLSDMILGASDGVITTFAIVSGVAGAKIEARVILILGIAKLLADGISMGSSNFLAIRSGAEAQATPRGIQEPFFHALFTFIAFVLVGAVPLLGYLIPGTTEYAFAVSASSSAFVLFAVGWVRASLVGRRGVFSGLEMVLIGAIAGAAAYWVGAFVERWVG